MSRKFQSSASDDPRSLPWATFHWGWAALVLTTLVFAVFHPVLTHDYGTSDDYSNFANVRFDIDPRLDYWRSLGRPVSALIYRLVTERIDTFSEATLMRWVYLLMLSGSACAIFAVSRRAGLDSLTSLVVAALSTLSPATVDLGSFTTELGDPLGIVAVAGAFLGWWTALERHETAPRVAAWAAVCVIAIVFALATYQTTAFMWVFFLALAALTPRRFEWVTLRRIVHGLIVFAAGLVTYRVLVMGLYVRWIGLEATGRAELTSQPLFKLAWFFLMPLRDALHLFVVLPYDLVLDNKAALLDGSLGPVAFVTGVALRDPSYWLAIAVGTALIVGLGLHFRGSVRMRWLAVAAASALLPASYLLNIVISSIWSPYRTQLALYSIVCFYSVIAIRAACSRLPRHGPMLAALTLIAYVEFAAVSMHWVNREYVVEPLSCEWRQLVRSVGHARGDDRLLVLPVAERDTAAPGLRYELGRQAGAAPWAPKSMVLAARHELSLPEPEIRVLGRGETVTWPPPDGVGVIRLGCTAE